jgi:hypothetical protein
MVALIFAAAYVAHGYFTPQRAGVPRHCYTVKDDTTGKGFSTCDLPALAGK